MNILVTGSSGWLGQTLVPRLRRDGHQVVGLDPEKGATTDNNRLSTSQRRKYIPVAKHVQDQSIVSISHRALRFKTIDLKRSYPA